jgi:hypothetical protein
VGAQKTVARASEPIPIATARGQRRRRFLDAIEHRPESHAPWAEEPPPSEIKSVRGRDGEPWTEAALLNHARHCRRTAHLVGAALAGDGRTLSELARAHRSNCGWWWCHEDEHKREPPWENLLVALRALKRSKIDPWGDDVADAAWLYVRGEDFAHEKGAREEVHRRLTEMVAELDRDPRLAVSELTAVVHSAALQTKRLARQAALVRAGENSGQRLAIRFARSMGWTASDLAAVLYLTGIDRERSWQKVRKKVDRMWRNVHNDRRNRLTL